MNKPYKINTHYWYIERLTYLIAGIFVFITSLLAYFIHKDWIFGTLFVSLMLINFSITGYCPMAMFLKKIGAKEK